MTAFGLVEVRRAYFACPACGMGDYALDARLGLEGFLGPQARQFVCLAAADVSFAKAQRLLDELLGPFPAPLCRRLWRSFRIRASAERQRC